MKHFCVCFFTILQFFLATFQENDKVSNPTVDYTPIREILQQSDLPIEFYISMMFEMMSSKGDGGFCFGYPTSRERDCFLYQEVSNITLDLVTIYEQTYYQNAKMNIRDLDAFFGKYDKLQFLDYYVVLKCLYLWLSDENVQNDFVVFSRIINNISKHYLPTHVFHEVIDKLFSLPSGANKHLITENDNSVLSVWNPFHTKIKGFALYQGDHHLKLKSIIRNDSWMNIDTTDLYTAGYIPTGFLESIMRDISKNQTELFYVFMIFLRDTTRIKNDFLAKYELKNVLGVQIPHFCKTNNLSLLKAYFKEGQNVSGEWVNFGGNYFDSSINYEEAFCVLNQISYFGRTNNTDNRYFESVKDSYCLPYALSNEYGNVSYGQTLRGKEALPDHFCMNADLELNLAFCLDDGYVFVKKVVCFDHPISQRTEQLYQMFAFCSIGGACNPFTFPNDSDVSYVDIVLYFYITYRTGIAYDSFDSFFNVFQQGIELLKVQAENDYQMAYITHLLQSFIIMTPYYIPGSAIISKENIVFQKFRVTKQDSIVGIVLYKDQTFKQLTTENDTFVYEFPDNVELILKLSNTTLPHDSYGDSSIYVIVINDDYYIKNNISSTRIVAIYYTYLKALKFDMYMKTLDGSDEEYWFSIECKTQKIKTIFISEPERNLGDTTKKLTTIRIDDSFVFSDTYDVQPKTKFLKQNVDISSYLFQSKGKRKFLTRAPAF